MPIKLGSTGLGAIYQGSNKIASIYKGSDLVYQIVSGTPSIQLLERTIKKVTPDMFESKVSYIRQYVFYNCISLEEVELPSTVTQIETYAFYGCSSLNSMKLNSTTPPTLASATYSISSATKTIYVPSGSKSAYESATVWVDLLTRSDLYGGPVTFVEF